MPTSEGKSNLKCLGRCEVSKLTKKQEMSGYSHRKTLEYDCYVWVSGRNPSGGNKKLTQDEVS